MWQRQKIKREENNVHQRFTDRSPFTKDRNMMVIRGVNFYRLSVDTLPM